MPEQTPSSPEKKINFFDKIRTMIKKAFNGETHLDYMQHRVAAAEVERWASTLGKNLEHILEGSFFSESNHSLPDLCREYLVSSRGKRTDNQSLSSLLPTELLPFKPNLEVGEIVLRFPMGGNDRYWLYRARLPSDVTDDAAIATRIQVMYGDNLSFEMTRLPMAQGSGVVSAWSQFEANQDPDLNIKKTFTFHPPSEVGTKELSHEVLEVRHEMNKQEWLAVKYKIDKLGQLVAYELSFQNMLGPWYAAIDQKNGTLSWRQGEHDPRTNVVTIEPGQISVRFSHNQVTQIPTRYRNVEDIIPSQVGLEGLATASS